MRRKVNVLMTGVGAPGAPGIIKSLRLCEQYEIKIVGVDIAPETSSGAGMVDAVEKVPAPEDERFVPELERICRRHDVQVVLPLVTRELPVLAAIRERFRSEGVGVVVSGVEPLRIANNKHLLMEACRGSSVRTPEFYRVTTWREFREAVRTLGYPRNSVCFKPPVSNGMRGFRVLAPITNRLERLLTQKPDDVVISLADFESIVADAQFFPELLVMEFLPGDEFSVDVLSDGVHAMTVIPRLRDKVKMGISFHATTTEDVVLMGQCREIVEKIKLFGAVGLQFRRDGEGVLKIIECNPRVQGTIVLCTAAGANLIEDCVTLGLGQPVVRRDVRWGTHMVRFWDEVYYQSNRWFRL